MKKLLLIASLLLLISDFGYAATRKIYINFDNQPSINASTGVITPNTAPSQGTIKVLYWAGTDYPAVLGTKSQYITGRGGTGYALSGIINNAEGPYTGTWPYIMWEVGENVSWSSEIYVSFWYKYVNFKVCRTSQAYCDSIGQTYKPFQNIKLFYWNFNPGSSGSKLAGELSSGNTPGGSSPPYNEYGGAWRGNTEDTNLWYYDWPFISDAEGNWHHHEFHLNRAAGRAKWWVDGNLIRDWNPGYPNLGDSSYYIRWMSLAGAIIGTGPNSMGTRAFDDIEVWDGLPGTTSYILPPPSTSPKSPNSPAKLLIQ